MSLYSIRESLQGALQTFVRESGLDSTFIEELVRDFVALLAAYREEDIPMFPSVFVAQRREDLSSILTTGTPVRIGKVPRAQLPAEAVLKDCAPLAKEGWAVFCYIEGENVQYGVFRSTRHALSTAADEVVADLGSEVRVLMLRNCGHQSVEILNTSGGRMTAVLRVSRSIYDGLDKHVIAFTQAATRAVSDPFELQAYLKRTLTSIVQHCHGTLLLVVPADYKRDEWQNSGVVPEPGLNFAELHAAAMKFRDADSISDLRAAQVLLEGMILSDGIVVFGDDGSVLAYRCFVKPELDEESTLKTEGGARRRAFNIMKLRLGSRYLAALYRSQDGETKCEVTGDAN